MTRMRKLPIPQHRALEMRNAFGLFRPGARSYRNRSSCRSRSRRQPSRPAWQSSLNKPRLRPFSRLATILPSTPIGRHSNSPLRPALHRRERHCRALPAHARRRERAASPRCPSIAVAFDPRLQREPLLQQRNGVVGLEFLPNPTPALMKSIVRMMTRSAQCPSTADSAAATSIIHGIGPQKKARKTLKHADMMLDERILAVLRESPRRLCLAQPGDRLTTERDSRG